MAIAPLEQRVTLVDSQTLMENYLARTPLAHALFRAAELWLLEEAALERPVLDVGCGRGEFARLALDGGFDAGVDLSARHLSVARRTGCYGQLRQADACCLPYPSEAFRSVLSISVLEHIPAPDRAVQEMYRVLAPGGLFVATVVLRDIHRHLAFAGASRRWGLPRLAEAYVRLHELVFRHVSLLSQRQWEDLLSETGFEPVRTTRVVSGRIVRWWEGLMWLAWPYRLCRPIGNLLACKPRWLARWLQRRFASLLRQDDDEGACLFIVAQKPDWRRNSDERPRTGFDGTGLVSDRTHAFNLLAPHRGCD